MQIYRTTTGLEFHKLKLHRKEVQEQQEEPAAGAPFKCDKCHKELSTKKCFHVCIEEASSNVEEKKKRFQCGICKKVLKKQLHWSNFKSQGDNIFLNRCMVREKHSIVTMLNFTVSSKQAIGNVHPSNARVVTRYSRLSFFLNN